MLPKASLAEDPKPPPVADLEDPVTVLRAQIRFESAHDDEDDMMNVFHFVGQRAEADNATDMVEDFYADAGSASSPLGNSFADSVLTGGYEIKVYDLEDPKPRAPIYDRTGQVNPASSTPVPPQCSVVLSFNSQNQSGVRVQRLRNRIYIGGWAQGALSPGGFVHDNIVFRIQQAAQDMLDASEASINLSWCTFSPTLAAGSNDIEAGAFPVVGGWVDNSWDIQRRRKINASQRSVWPEV